MGTVHKQHFLDRQINYMYEIRFPNALKKLNLRENRTGNCELTVVEAHVTLDTKHRTETKKKKERKR